MSNFETQTGVLSALGDTLISRLQVSQITQGELDGRKYIKRTSWRSSKSKRPRTEERMELGSSKRADYRLKQSATLRTLVTTLKVANRALKETSDQYCGPCYFASGEKQTLWVNNFEEKHFLQFINRLEKDNGVTVDDKGTLLHLSRLTLCSLSKESEEGRKYNRIMFILVDSGEDIQNNLIRFDPLPT